MGHLTRIANAVAQSLERGPVQGHVIEAIRGEPEPRAGLPGLLVPLAPSIVPPPLAGPVPHFWGPPDSRVHPERQPLPGLPHLPPFRPGH